MSRTAIVTTVHRPRRSDRADRRQCRPCRAIAVERLRRGGLLLQRLAEAAQRRARRHGGLQFSTTLRNRATSVDGGGQQSVAFAGARCFSINAGTLGRKLGPQRPQATRGSRHTLAVTRYRGGDRSRSVSVATSFKIRRQGSRADAVRQLGC